MRIIRDLISESCYFFLIIFLSKETNSILISRHIGDEFVYSRLTLTTLPSILKIYKQTTCEAIGGKIKTSNLPCNAEYNWILTENTCLDNKNEIQNNLCFKSNTNFTCSCESEKGQDDDENNKVNDDDDENNNKQQKKRKQTIGEYGLSHSGNTITLCKTDNEGWDCTLEFTMYDEPTTTSLLSYGFSNLRFILGEEQETKSLSVTSSGVFNIAIESSISIVSLELYEDLKKLFFRNCELEEDYCVGTRVRTAEYKTGSFACYSMLGYPSAREWLENGFPMIQIHFDNDNFLCVSPWSYFVPVGQGIYCVGILASSETREVHQKSWYALGSNLLEGNKIQYMENGDVTIVPAVNTENCILSKRTCSRKQPATTSSPTTKKEVPFPQPTKNKQTTVEEGPFDEEEEPEEEEIPETQSPTMRKRVSTRSPSITLTDSPFSNVANDMPDDDGSNSDPYSMNFALFYVGIGAGISFILLMCICIIYCCCCRQKGGNFTRVATTDVEMTPTTPNASPPPSAVAATNHRVNSIPVMVAQKPPLTSIFNSVAGPFEPSPKLSGGATSFEKAWNQGLVVDVWGATLKSVPVGNSLTSTLVKLRLLLVANGTISGIEKIYWVAKIRPVTLTALENLGMIEMSIDLSTKRLSVVFKISKNGTKETQVHLQALFDTFKRVIEEMLC